MDLKSVLSAYGFDLDAVGVINSSSPNGLAQFPVSSFQFPVYPNPVSNGNVQLQVDENLVGNKIKVYDVTGKVLSADKIESQYSILNTQYFSKGVYFLSICSQVSKLVIQ